MEKAANINGTQANIFICVICLHSCHRLKLSHSINSFVKSLNKRLGTKPELHNQISETEGDTNIVLTAPPSACNYKSHRELNKNDKLGKKKHKKYKKSQELSTAVNFVIELFFVWFLLTNYGFLQFTIVLYST